MSLVAGERVYPELIEGFAGERRSLSDNLLPPSVSPDALNIDYRDGTLRKRRGIRRLGTISTAVASAGDIEAMAPKRALSSFVVATRSRVYSFGSNLTGGTALATDSSRPFRAQLVRHLNDTVVLNGYAANLIAQTWALSYPAPTLTSGLTITAAGSGGSLSAGVYRYLFSIYNSLSGVESAVATQISTQTAGASDEFTLDFTSGGWNAGSHAGADKIRIYRTKADGVLFYHVADIAIASTSYVDGAADTGLVSLRPEYVGYAAPSRFGFTLNNALWLGNQAGVENRLVYTEPGTLGGFYSENYVDIGDTRALTGGIALGGRAAVFKLEETWLVSGAGDSVSAELFFPGVGCVQHATIAASHEAVYWLGQSGVYRMPLPLGAGAPESLTLDGWRDFFEGMTAADFERCCGVWDALSERYILTLTVAGVRHVLVYCARQGSWALWDADVTALVAGNVPSFSAHIHCGFRGWVAAFETGLSDARYAVDIFSQAMRGVATGGSTTTLENSGALWMTDSGGMLLGMDVTVTYSDGVQETRRITGNTATVLTVTPSWTAPSAGDTYFLGAIRAYWESPRLSFGRWDRLKVFDRLRVLNRVPSDDVEAVSAVTFFVEPEGDLTRRESFLHAMSVAFSRYGILRGLCRALVAGVEDFSPDQTFDIAGIGLSYVERTDS